MENAIKLNNISKKYNFHKNDNKIMDDFRNLWALRNISLEVGKGQILGVIGRNGAGKTTLLNIIAGLLSPTEGEVFRNGKHLGLFNLGVGFQDELTGRENIYLNGAIVGAAKDELNNKLNSIIEFSELGDFVNMPLGSYSQGMRLRLGFSIAANLDFDILVIDEILAVGDVLFQNKCYERLMDFRRANKTLIITNQSMDLIARLTDKVALLEHGNLEFLGGAEEGINRYRLLLNTQKFFVGPVRDTKLVEDTKKWADDTSSWGKKFGTKEVAIGKVELINKFGRKCNSIKSKQPLKIKVNFLVKNDIKEPHFGVAIFRKDGVYCYGPNTQFDRLHISELKRGKGWFTLRYKEVSLAPGEYRISVAIWDKFETVAYDYHNGYYELLVRGGDNQKGELLSIPFKDNLMNAFCRKPNLDILDGKRREVSERLAIKLASVKLFDSKNEEKNVFMTGESMKITLHFDDFIADNKHSVWIGIYREDGIYCQGMICPVSKKENFQISFPKLPLLPGNYKLSFGIWDNIALDFLTCSHGIHRFKMVFDRCDHGTVYLEHKWNWRVY